MTEEKNKDLFYLDELSDYKVADEYPDVRGWNLKDSENRTIGKVDNLLVSKMHERVVYLDVEVDDDLIEAGKEFNSSAGQGIHEYTNEDGDKHLIVPIGMADLNEDEKEVYATGINYDTFARTKRYTKDRGVDRDYEMIVYKNYLPDNYDSKTAESDKDFYSGAAFDNKRNRK